MGKFHGQAGSWPGETRLKPLPQKAFLRVCRLPGKTLLSQAFRFKFTISCSIFLIQLKGLGSQIGLSLSLLRCARTARRCIFHNISLGAHGNQSDVSARFPAPSSVD
jgi:hypothetical protein